MRTVEEMTRAHGAVSQALKRHDLERPDRCSECGRVGEVVGHHADYSKPLDVQWLCPSCHGVEHARIRAEENPRSRKAYIIAFRVGDDVFAELDHAAELASEAAAGVPITRSEMARVAFLRGMAVLLADYEKGKGRK